MKNLKVIPVAALSLALSATMLAGCTSGDSSSSSSASASSSASSAATEEAIEVSQVEMAYISPEDVEANLDNEDYLVVDLRKASDYEAGHIPGAISADMDKAKDGDNQSGIDNMTAALTEATGSETGDGKTLVMVCYSGSRYAQAGTNILAALGADMDSVYTLEGGMKAWTGATEQ